LNFLSERSERTPSSPTDLPLKHEIATFEPARIDPLADIVDSITRTSPTAAADASRAVVFAMSPRAVKLVAGG